MLMHTDSNPHVCDICGKVFSTNCAVQLHRKNVHGLDEPYQCPDCDRAFRSDIELRQHRFSHRAGRHFKCKLCGKKYNYNTGLKYHMQAAHRSESLLNNDDGESEVKPSLQQLGVDSN
ncbi:zinc finger protein 93-like [Sabethes cyaneus]|uniref:zinc finger protein 93-like n=1 Tax=Sabethes cyaneus TaxID=53552 RepID=UPI00237D47EF|nr:zinc finger protein 93-like [Sabethes cyaneus]